MGLRILFKGQTGVQILLWLQSCTSVMYLYGLSQALFYRATGDAAAMILMRMWMGAGAAHSSIEVDTTPS